MIITLHGPITQESASQVSQALAQGGPVEVHIDSPGGDLFAGLNIYNALSSYSEDVEIYIDNVAASVASVISLAGRKPPKIAPHGSMQIHNAHVEQTGGNHNDLRKIANSLEKYSEIVAMIYAKKTGQDLDTVIEAMNNEQVFKADEAQAFGLVGETFNPIQAFAQITNIDMKLLDRIKNQLAAPVTAEPVAPEMVEETIVEPVAEPEGFSPEQLEQITAIVAEMIAEALAGQSEEVGNVIATVFNEIRSEGKPPTSASITAPGQSEQGGDPGVTAFYAKMKSIKNKQA